MFRKMDQYITHNYVSMMYIKATWGQSHTSESENQNSNCKCKKCKSNHYRGNVTHGVIQSVLDYAALTWNWWKVESPADKSTNKERIEFPLQAHKHIRKQTQSSLNVTFRAAAKRLN